MKLRQRWRDFRRKFWLGVHRYSGQKVGSGRAIRAMLEDFWRDTHRAQASEDLIFRVIAGEEAASSGRDVRSGGREIRDGR